MPLHVVDFYLILAAKRLNTPMQFKTARFAVEVNVISLSLDADKVDRAHSLTRVTD